MSLRATKSIEMCAVAHRVSKLMKSEEHRSGEGGESHHKGN